MNENRFLSILNSGGERFRFAGRGGRLGFGFEFTLAGFCVGTSFTSSAFLNIVPGIGRSKRGLFKRAAAVEGGNPGYTRRPGGFFFGLLGCGSAGKLDGSGGGGGGWVGYIGFN